MKKKIGEPDRAIQDRAEIAAGVAQIVRLCRPESFRSRALTRPYAHTIDER